MAGMIEKFNRRNLKYCSCDARLALYIDHAYVINRMLTQIRRLKGRPVGTNLERKVQLDEGRKFPDRKVAYPTVRKATTDSSRRSNSKYQMAFEWVLRSRKSALTYFDYYFHLYSNYYYLKYPAGLVAATNCEPRSPPAIPRISSCFLVRNCSTLLAPASIRKKNRATLRASRTLRPLALKFKVAGWHLVALQRTNIEGIKCKVIINTGGLDRKATRNK